MFELKKSALQTTFYPWLRWDSCCINKSKMPQTAKETVLIQIYHAVHEVMTKFIHDTNWAEFFELHHLLMSSTSAIVWWHLTGEIRASITGCIHLLIFAERDGNVHQLIWMEREFSPLFSVFKLMVLVIWLANFFLISPASNSSR